MNDKHLKALASGGHPLMLGFPDSGDLLIYEGPVLELCEPIEERQ
jgi:hypothetical protein